MSPIVTGAMSGTIKFYEEETCYVPRPVKEFTSII